MIFFFIARKSVPDPADGGLLKKAGEEEGSQ